MRFILVTTKASSKSPSAASAAGGLHRIEAAATSTGGRCRSPLQVELHRDNEQNRRLAPTGIRLSQRLAKWLDGMQRCGRSPVRIDPLDEVRESNAGMIDAVFEFELP